VHTSVQVQGRFYSHPSGFYPAAFVGGAAGIEFAGMFFGLPLEPGLLSRLIVLASMLAWVLISGTAIVTASSAVGWLIGSALGTTVPENSLTAVERR
jgi:hypothetical protein